MRKNQQEIKNNHPHNNAFQRLFAHKVIIIEFLKKVLPSALLNIVELSTLVIEKGDFVNYMKGLCDLVVSVRFKNFDLFIRLVFNIEHQSYIHKHIFQKLFKYQSLLYEHYKSRRCLVISVLLYHGFEKWHVSSSFQKHLMDKGDLPREYCDILRPYLIDFNYILSDVSQFDIGKERSSIVNPILYVFQQIWSLKQLKSSIEKKEFLKKCFLLVEKEAIKYEKTFKSHKNNYESNEKLDIIEIISDLVTYFCEYDQQITEDLLKAASKEVKEEAVAQDIGGKVMDGLNFTIQGAKQKGIQIGVEKGRQEGRQEIILNLLKANMDIQKICELTHLSEQEVLQIQSKI